MICKSEVYQQDGAPAHTTRLVTGCLRFEGIEYIKDWPGNSPGLNPIENFWYLIKRNLQGKDISSVSKLQAAIEASWNNLDLAKLRSLALSLPRHLKAVLKRKGHPTKY